MKTFPKSNIKNETDNIDSFLEIKELQQLQDLFSEVHQVASIITSPKGIPLTNPTNFCELCKMIRKTKIGAYNCCKSDSMISQSSLMEPSIRKCSAGLWDAGTPIVIGDKHIANWLIGQVRSTEIDKDKLSTYANEIGVDVEAYIEAYKEVPAMSESKLYELAKFLQIYVNQLSDKVYNKQLLKKANNELKQISQNIPDIIWKGEWDNKSERLTNTYISELVDKKLMLTKGTINNNIEKYLSYVNSKYTDRLQSYLRKSINNPGKVYSETYEIERGDGSKAWFKSTGNTYKNDDRLEIYGITKDITDEKNMIYDLQVAKEKAEKSDKLKTAFLSNMSHEIRTPMNSILGFIELLGTPDLSESEKKEYSEIINSNGERLLNTILGIIDYSRIEAGDIVIINEEVNLKDVFESHLAFIRSESKDREIKVNLKIAEPDRPATIKIDKNKLNSILSNLLNNALKFTSKGEINFGYHFEGNLLRCFVSDTGVGIPKEKINSIFERFTQVDATDTRNYDGNGLGLAICRGYIEKMGGKIWLESVIDKGSIFNFTLECER